MPRNRPYCRYYFYIKNSTLAHNLMGFSFSVLHLFKYISMGLLYNLSINLYNAAIHAAMPFNSKAKLWAQGRNGIFEKLEAAFKNNASKVIWMHCASLGEFEQGRPVLEALKKQYPHYKILLTFFSPSGYEVRKNYTGANWVFYLPADTPQNAQRFITITKPALAIFVKYEYWYNFLSTLNKRKIPTLLISALFKKDSIFFKFYGILQRRMIHFFDSIFVQDVESKTLLSNITDATKIEVAGDTRFDRVKEIAEAFTPIPEIEKFLYGRKAIVAGSTWPDDEKHLKNALEHTTENIALIIAPHEVNNSHIELINRLFSNSILFSELKILCANNSYIPQKTVLIIDNIGMLSRLYHYATLTYIGGGFNKAGIHNTLEAAVYGKPVIFGPNYKKFGEAIKLIEKGGGLSYNEDNQLIKIINSYINNREAGAKAGEFVANNTGATERIMERIRQIVF